MDILLKIPEHNFCLQNEKFEKNGPNDCLIFIAKGKCKVLVEDTFGERKEEKEVRILGSGDHFGDISMLY